MIEFRGFKSRTNLIKNNMEKMNMIETVTQPLVRKFMTGESRYCQNCGKESHTLFEIIKEDKVKNKLQYCKECVNSK